MNQVKTLLERAKPEIAEALESLKVNYPYTYERLVDFLNAHFFCNDITWGIWVDLRSAIFGTVKRLPQDPWELFEDFK